MRKTIKNINIEIPGLKIISKIGDGGMSVVYLAEQVSLKRKVAVKVMRMEIAKNDLDIHRFKHEAKTIAQLDHPSIISIYNIGQTKKGEIYFTMPYLNHGDFSNYLLENEQEFINLLLPICDGLAFAHNRGVIHRDIKPENLLFDKFGNIVIADFGIAISREGSRMTKEHQIVGSAQYMSPEQARSLKVGAATDIYSLGIVIYERLTGKVPFDSDDSISILVNHVSMDVPRLPAKMRHWQELIDKCLAKSPKDRFSTMLELKEAIKNIPTNSLQRTSSSIQRVLSDEKGKHLKWFAPLLLLLMVFGLYKLFSNDQPEPSTIANEPANNTNQIAKQAATNKAITNNTDNDNINLQNTQAETQTPDLATTNEIIAINETNPSEQSSSLTIDTITALTVEKDNIPEELEPNQNDLSTESTTLTEIANTANDKIINPDDFTDVTLSETSSQTTPETTSETTLAEATLADANTENDNKQTTTTNDEQNLTINNNEEPTQDSQESEKQKQIQTLLVQAADNIKHYKLSKPAKNNATDQLLSVLSLDKNNQDAKKGLETIGGKYYQLVLSALRKKDYNKALKYSLSFAQFNKKIKYSNKNLVTQKKSIIETIAKIKVGAQSFPASRVNTLIRIIKIYAPKHALIADFQQQAKNKLGPQVGETLTDDKGIETILVTRKLAAMTHEVTVEEYSEFAQATHIKASKCKHNGGSLSFSFSKKTWQKPFFPQTMQHPVVCVTVDDAQKYADWLSQETGNNYRLPNKKDWMMLAALNKNNYQACKTSNVAGIEAKKIRNKQENYNCNDGNKFTAAVESYAKNSLGLYDLQGNVSEWLACDTHPCPQPTAIGSSWFDGTKSTQINMPKKQKPALAFSSIGFRLVRDL